VFERVIRYLHNKKKPRIVKMKCQRYRFSNLVLKEIEHFILNDLILNSILKSA